MTDIDITKIRPGDRVTLVPLEVHSVDAGWVALFTDLEGIVQFDWPQIAAHHPAPREFKAGDRVTMSGDVGTILCIDDTDAWVRWDTGYRSTRPVERLTLVEGGE